MRPSALAAASDASLAGRTRRAGGSLRALVALITLRALVTLSSLIALHALVALSTLCAISSRRTGRPRRYDDGVGGSCGLGPTGKENDSGDCRHDQEDEHYSGECS